MNKIIASIVFLFSIQFSGLKAQNYLKPMIGEDDKYGFIDSISGKWVIAPKYLTAGYFSKNGLAFVCKTKTKCGCIDVNGKVKIPFRYIYDINYLSRLKQGWRNPSVVPVFNDSGLLVVNRLVKQKKHWYFGYGLIDSDGKEILPLKYAFREETPTYYIVNGEEESNSGLGIVGLNGKFLLPQKYNGYEKLSTDTFILRYSKDRKMAYQFLNLNNTVVKDGEFEQVEFVKEHHYIIAKQNNMYGLMSAQTLENILPFDYDYIGYINHKTRFLLFVVKDSMIGFINPQGKPLTDRVYSVAPKSKIDYYHPLPVIHKRVLIMKNGFYGLLDFNAKEVSDFEYESIQMAYLLDASVLRIKKHGKYNYMDTSGNVFDFPYVDSAFLFNRNFGIFIQDGNYGILNKKGEQTLPLTTKKISYISDLNSSVLDLNYVGFKQDSLLGIMRFDGKIVSAAKYKEVFTVQIDRRFKNIEFGEEFVNGFLVKNGETYQFIDTLGNSILSEKIDEIYSDVNRYEHFPGGFRIVIGKEIFFMDWKERKLVPIDRDSRF
jgi:hypothetical protein